MRTTLTAPVASACALPGRRPAPWLEHPGVKPGGDRHHLPQQRVGVAFVTAWSHEHSTHNTDRHTQPMNTHHNATTVHIAHHTHTHTHATDRRGGHRSSVGVCSAFFRSLRSLRSQQSDIDQAPGTNHHFHQPSVSGAHQATVHRRTIMHRPTVGVIRNLICM